jgi:hypothetical protein
VHRPGQPGQTQVYFIPANVTAAPGQGIRQSTTIGNSTGLTQPSEASQLAGANTTLTNPAGDAFNERACAAMGLSGPCPFWSVVPEPMPHETPDAYVLRLEQAGLHGTVTTLRETDPSAGNGEIVTARPDPGTTVEAGGNVELAVNPGIPKVSESDPRCDVNNGGGSTGDPGDPPSDGSSYPQYQTVENSPYPAGVDPSGSSPPVTQIPLRWGTTRWGWRHLLQAHPYTSADESQTAAALASDPVPMPSWSSQWIFHRFYDMPDGSGGTINCVRSVSVEYAVEPNAEKAGLAGIRGIQDSYTGKYLGGVPGH